VDCFPCQPMRSRNDLVREVGWGQWRGDHVEGGGGCCLLLWYWVHGVHVLGSPNE